MRRLAIIRIFVSAGFSKGFSNGALPKNKSECLLFLVKLEFFWGIKVRRIRKSCLKALKRLIDGFFMLSLFSWFEIECLRIVCQSKIPSTSLAKIFRLKWSYQLEIKTLFSVGFTIAKIKSRNKTWKKKLIYY